MLGILAGQQTAGLFILDVTVSWARPCLKGFCLMIPGMRYLEWMMFTLVMQHILDVMIPLKVLVIHGCMMLTSLFCNIRGTGYIVKH